MDMTKVKKDMADSLVVWGEVVTGGTYARAATTAQAAAARIAVVHN
jgi:hypothetical protein